MTTTARAESAPEPASDKPAARLAAQLEAIINKRIAADQLVLPSISTTSAKCLALLRSSDFSLREAAKLIEGDPMLAAEILRVTNSAALGAREPIRSVLQAVTRMGVQRLRSFLVESSTRKVFESRDVRIGEACRALWRHSVAVAVMARDVTAVARCGDPEFAYLAGLLHDVGKPIVGAMLLEAEKAIGVRGSSVWIGSSDWVAVVQRIHRPIGLALAERWEMPPEVLSAMRQCEDYDSSERGSVPNAVRFANALAKQAGLYVGEVNAEDVDALVMIGRSLLGVDEEINSRLIDAAKESCA